MQVVQDQFSRLVQIAVIFDIGSCFRGASAMPGLPRRERPRLREQPIAFRQASAFGEKPRLNTMRPA